MATNNLSPFIAGLTEISYLVIVMFYVIHVIACTWFSVLFEVDEGRSLFQLHTPSSS